MGIELLLWRYARCSRQKRVRNLTISGHSALDRHAAYEPGESRSGLSGGNSN